MDFDVLLKYGFKSERAAEAPLTLIEVTSDKFLETRIAFQSKVLRVGKVVKALTWNYLSKTYPSSWRWFSLYWPLTQCLSYRNEASNTYSWLVSASSIHIANQFQTGFPSLLKEQSNLYLATTPSLFSWRLRLCIHYSKYSAGKYNILGWRTSGASGLVIV